VTTPGLQELTPCIPPLDGATPFDLPGINVGVAEYTEGPTGCTVFAFDRMLATAVDIRGGLPGTSLTAIDMAHLQAICFAGGSILGLEAAAGVTAAIFAQRGHEHVDFPDIKPVSGAIIFDFGRPNGVYPDRTLGAAAYHAARAGLFLSGRHGAGRSASVGKGIPGLQPEPGGQGVASARIGGVRIAVFTVVNALGAIVDRENRVVRGHLERSSGHRRHLHEVAARGAPTAPGPGNTTLTVVATDARLDLPDLRQLARQVHASMARAIQPFHTPLDGDTLFAVATGDGPADGGLDVASLGALASEFAWDAVLDAVHDRES
jgi:L-aminopeptidase/D-esterase-like protein